MYVCSVLRCVACWSLAFAFAGDCRYFSGDQLVLRVARCALRVQYSIRRDLFGT